MVTARREEPTSFTSHCAYDVFLSFRGEDTRKSFTDHLYSALVHSGFRTFRDDEDLEIGENIRLELQKAIQKSRVSLIVFSKNFASSIWILEELVMALECKRNTGLVIWPVFYDVDPSKLRNQVGLTVESISRNEERRSNAETDERKTEGLDKVKEWKAALREFVDIGGKVLQNQSYHHESEFAQKIVEDVADELRRTVLGSVPLHYGVDGSKDGDIQLICGLGGMGKTTLAKLLYDSNYEKFDGSSFVANIRGTLLQPNGLVRLQKQFLSDILQTEGIEVSSVDVGINRIKLALSCRRVLVVLDDVDHAYQLDGLLGMQTSFHPGSRIIITSRHKQLLKGYEPCRLYEVERLNEEESLALFCWHAFGKNHLVEDYKDLSKRLVQQCGGLPLAIKVLGSSLYGRGVLEWRRAMEELKDYDSQGMQAGREISFDPVDMHARLKVSYYSLGDEDKTLFLDIACFFVGEDKDYVARILEGCGFYAEIGIQNLIDRSLLMVDEDNRVMMHRLLQDMGREIVRQESPEEPGKRSRLWRREDAFHVLSGRTGTEAIEGLALEFHASTDNVCRLGLFSQLPMISSSGKSVESAAFSRMRKLRLLRLHNVRLTGGYEEFPKKLRWLSWRGLRCSPDDIPMENLVGLDMQHCSSLEQVWKGTKSIPRLELLDLSHCHGLTSTPDFSGLPNLERLILEDCINLVEVHESVVELKRLRLLNLNGCGNLRKLPRGFGRLKPPEELVISGCSKLDPEELRKLEIFLV